MLDSAFLIFQTGSIAFAAAKSFFITIFTFSANIINSLLVRRFHGNSYVTAQKSNSNTLILLHRQDLPPQQHPYGYSPGEPRSTVTLARLVWLCSFATTILSSTLFASLGQDDILQFFLCFRIIYIGFSKEILEFDVENRFTGLAIVFGNRLLEHLFENTAGLTYDHLPAGYNLLQILGCCLLGAAAMASALPYDPIPVLPALPVAPG